MVDDINDWGTQSNVVDDHIRAVRVATEYKDLVKELKEGNGVDTTGWDGVTSDASDAYDDAKAISDDDESDTSGRKDTWDDKIAAVASALNTLDNLIARLATQEAEEEAQVAIKALADGDHAAQVDI